MVIRIYTTRDLQRLLKTSHMQIYRMIKSGQIVPDRRNPIMFLSNNPTISKKVLKSVTENDK